MPDVEHEADHEERVVVVPPRHQRCLVVERLPARPGCRAALKCCSVAALRDRCRLRATATTSSAAATASTYAAADPAAAAAAAADAAAAAAARKRDVSRQQRVPRVIFR